MLLKAHHALAECGVFQQESLSRPVFGRDDFRQRRRMEPKLLRAARSLPPHQERESAPPEASQSAQSQLELLERLTSKKEKDTDENTIGEQLAKKAVVGNEEEVVIPLGKQVPLEYDDLTISQKRNIRRQKYLDQVSKRNDAPLFTAIALFVILPPAVILAVAVATGYINLLP